MFFQPWAVMRYALLVSGSRAMVPLGSACSNFGKTGELAVHLVLQRQLRRGLPTGPIVGGAGLRLALSAPPRPVRGVVQAGPGCSDEGVEQAPEFGHGQRDELASSGCGAPFSAVARVADR
jgi:hypothetical protein